MASEPWSHHFDEEEWRKRVEHLANQLFADPVAFTTELAWLNSNEAKAAAEVGHFVGRLDAGSQKYLTQIADAAIQHQADAFAAPGYVYGVTERPGPTLERLNGEIDRIQEANPKLAFFIMLPPEISFAASSVLTVVNSGGPRKEFYQISKSGLEAVKRRHRKQDKPCACCCRLRRLANARRLMSRLTSWPTKSIRPGRNENPISCAKYSIIILMTYGHCWISSSRILGGKISGSHRC